MIDGYLGVVTLPGGNDGLQACVIVPQLGGESDGHDAYFFRAPGVAELVERLALPGPYKVRAGAVHPWLGASVVQALAPHLEHVEVLDWRWAGASRGPLGDAETSACAIAYGLAQRLSPPFC